MGSPRASKSITPPRARTHEPRDRGVAAHLRSNCRVPPQEHPAQAQPHFADTTRTARPRARVSRRLNPWRGQRPGCVCMKGPGPDADASGPGIFAELVSISSTRSAGVSDSAYFIRSIELCPTFDLSLGAPRGLQFTGRVSSGEVLIVSWFCRIHRAPDPQPTQPSAAGWDASAECYRR
jgi:hypothetical protein